MRAAAALLLAATAAGAATLSPADTVAIYRAAGLTVTGKTVTGCDTDDAKVGASRLEVAQADLNLDGRAEAIVTEYNPLCFGKAGQQFTIVGRDVGGRWHRLGQAAGRATVLRSRHLGWLEIGIAVPGGDVPARLRWTGTQYK